MKTIDFVIRHGYVVLFGWVFAEQIGLPLPAIPILLAAGALAGAGKMNFFLALALALVGCVLSDSIWYEIGRRRGGKVLSFLCRISLEPDSCVRRTEDSFARNGVRSLLIAKFVPGLSTAAPPLAGVFRMKFSRFLTYDGAGSLLWAGGFMGVGFLFSNQIEMVAEKVSAWGGGLLTVSLVGVGGYIAWKYTQRQLFLRKLRIARITPEELKQKLDAGEEVIVVDLRQSLDFEHEPVTLPGAIVITPEDLADRHEDIPRDRDIILYCT